MNIQGKRMVKGRGSAELFGDPERPSSQMKGIILGKESAHACGMKCGQSPLAWQRQTQDSSRQKNGRERSKRQDPPAPAPFHITACRACAAGCLLGAMGHQAGAYTFIPGWTRPWATRSSGWQGFGTGWAFMSLPT